jgi:hypothetical protein
VNIFWKAVLAYSEAAHSRSHRAWEQAHAIRAEELKAAAPAGSIMWEKSRVDFNYRKALAVRAHFYSMLFIQKAERKLDPQLQEFEEIIKHGHLQ